MHLFPLDDAIEEEDMVPARSASESELCVCSHKSNGFIFATTGCVLTRGGD